MSRKNLLAFLGTTSGGRYVIVTKYLLIASERLMRSMLRSTFTKGVGRIGVKFIAASGLWTINRYSDGQACTALLVNGIGFLASSRHVLWI
jgi:hypothetical protein